MCPVLDFANHSNEIQSSSPIPTFVSPASYTREGAELFLNYGQHSSIKFFTEYGFIPDDGQEQNAEVRLSDEIVGLFQQLGEKGHWMRDELIQQNYWSHVQSEHSIIQV